MLFWGKTAVCLKTTFLKRDLLMDPFYKLIWILLLKFSQFNHDRYLYTRSLNQSIKKHSTNVKNIQIRKKYWWDTPKKMYLSHSGKWMQVAVSLSHSSTFTCTTPVKPYKFLSFPGVVQVNVLEWLKEQPFCIFFPEWLK